MLYSCSHGSDDIETICVSDDIETSYVLMMVLERPSFLLEET